MNYTIRIKGGVMLLCSISIFILVLLSFSGFSGLQLNNSPMYFCELQFDAAYYCFRRVTGQWLLINIAVKLVLIEIIAIIWRNMLDISFNTNMLW